MSASTEKKLRREAREAGTDKKALAAAEEAKKAAKTRRGLTIGAVAAVIFIALVIFLNTSFMYTHTTALTIDDTKFTPAEVNYYYAEQYYQFVSNYGSYASYFGLDTSYGVSGLSSQTCAFLDDGTWADYFLDSAESQMKQLVALNKYAAEQGITLSDEDITNIDDEISSMSTYAEYYGYANTNKFLAAYYGKGVNESIAKKAMEYETLASLAYSAYSDSLEYTDAELEEYYESLNGADDVFSYAYYCVSAETVTAEDGTSAVTDETMAAAEETANAILDAYKAGSADTVKENLDAAVAEQIADATASESTGTNGSSLNSVYSEWMMDSSRTEGDVAVIESEGYGYYVVVFEGRNDNHYNTVNVRHILIQAEADEDGNYTDEAKAEALDKAEEILAEWKSGEATEESFAALAEEYSEDSGSNTNGGLYEDVYQGEMVTEFDAFCFDEGHVAGDTGIVYGESSSYAGYHVMYFVGEGDLYSNVLARSALTSTDISNWLTEITPEDATHGWTYNLAA